MLTWTQRSDGWHSNGLRIELAEPYRWLLLDKEKQPSAVGRGAQPLAVTRSLTECKREAELLMGRRRRSAVQRRQIVTILLVLAGTPLLVARPSEINGFIVVIAVMVATRSLTILLGTLAPKALGEQHEVFYQ